jgi:hypothetical protein
MLRYHLLVERRDGTWTAFEFRYSNDDDAIRHALRLRTRGRCELYQAERWLATFDAIAHDRQLPANDNVSLGNSPANTPDNARSWMFRSPRGRTATVRGARQRSVPDKTRGKRRTGQQAGMGHPKL